MKKPTKAFFFFFHISGISCKSSSSKSTTFLFGAGSEFGVRNLSGFVVMINLSLSRRDVNFGSVLNVEPTFGIIVCDPAAGDAEIMVVPYLELWRCCWRVW